MAKILVIEDEVDLAELVCYNLQKEGFEHITAASGDAGLKMALSEKPDLVILDLMLPGIQGMDVLRQIKMEQGQQSPPVIILSAKSSETDRVLGLELGADDYVTKPFSVKELISRVKAVLRRSENSQMQQEEKKTVSYKGLEIDFNAVSVKVEGQVVKLSPYEFRILAFFVTHPNKAYSRDELLNQVWEDDGFVQPRTVDVHIRKLRTIIEKDPKNPEYITTVRGFGYIFKLEG